MKLFSFWIGPLTYIERLCLTSMAAAGHEIDLYTYDADLPVPPGVTVKDAREVLPRDQVFVHRKTGSPAVFADIFRYHGLQRGLGLWVDTDVLVLKHLGGLGDHVVGLDSDRTVNNAVLHLPPDCSFLSEIIAFAREPVIFAPYWSAAQRAKQRAKSWLGVHKRLDQMPIGILGPQMLTLWVHRHGIKAQPREVLYPIHYNEAAALFNPAAQIQDRITPATRAVHLWNTTIREFKRRPPPAGSWLAKMCDRFAILPS